MKRILVALIAVFLFVVPAYALPVDITDSSLAHFGDFYNYNYPGDYSHISGDFVTNPDERDFGWHYSPSNHGSSIGGILLDPNSYAVTSLRFQVHSNPFRDFLLEGSANTTDGFNGDWDTLLSSTVTERAEQAFQSWDFSNANAYSAYRIHILNDYTPEGSGWAMYRWELLADDGSGSPVIPEPTTMLLLGTGLFCAFFRNQKRA